MLWTITENQSIARIILETFNCDRRDWFAEIICLKITTRRARVNEARENQQLNGHNHAEATLK